MRVIAGKHRGRKLITIDGDAVRPTSDRAKEGVFSVLQFEIVGKSFYDGFCGSGAMGIEAISRGASKVVFTDKAKASCECAKKNLSSLGEKATVINIDCIDYLKRTDEKFDIIFLDPPYKSDAGIRALEVIAKRNLLSENGIVVFESGNADNQLIDGLFVSKRKKYGIAEFAFYKKVNKDLAVFAGSFDPVTKGHVHLAKKAAEHFSTVVVAMGINENKKYTFDKFTRIQMLNCAFEDMPNIKVSSFDGYLVDFLKENQTVNNVRGIRNDEDMKYEEAMLEFNKKLFPEIKNVYIYADEDMKTVSSTAFKEAKERGENMQDYLPEKVLEIALKNL